MDKKVGYENNPKQKRSLNVNRDKNWKNEERGMEGATGSNEVQYK